MTIGLRTGTESSNPFELMRDITGTVVNPMTVGIAVQRQVSTGFLELTIEYLKNVPIANVM